MSNQLKIILYITLAILASISGYYALSSFGRMMDRAGNRISALEQIEPERKIPADAPPPETTTTNATATNTDAAVAGVTNVPASMTNAAAANITNAATNLVAASITNTLVQAENSSAVPTAGAAGAGTSGSKKGGRMGMWIGLFIISLVGLGLLIASDVSHYLGNRALKTIYNDEGEGMQNPEYDQAEQVWANGQHLEAIGLMREYLKKNPREQHVALRIAEIYEKDLGNHLAAALEYEEVLKHKLPPDRWGWAAIHLCNLYFKLNQEQKAYDLLRRIVKDYPDTPAADKARKRLEQVDGATVEQIATEPQVSPRTPAAPSPGAAPSNLPPGFRPKK